MIEADLRIRLAMHQQQRPQPPSSRSHQPRPSQQAHMQYYQQPLSALDSGRRQKWSAGATGIPADLNIQACIIVGGN